MKRASIDREALRRELDGVCFICELVAGNPEHAHQVIYEDEDTIAFLDKYPSLFGHVLVAPREHREQVTGDFTRDEYLELQAAVYRIAEAVRTVVPTERLYVLSLGSQQANRHVHWHLAPLPPGVPIQEQQLRALGGDTYLEYDADKIPLLMEALRTAIGPSRR